MGSASLDIAVMRSDVEISGRLCIGSAAGIVCTCDIWLHVSAFEQGKGGFVVSLRIYRLIRVTFVELFGIRENKAYGKQAGQQSSKFFVAIFLAPGLACLALTYPVTAPGWLL